MTEPKTKTPTPPNSAFAQAFTGNPLLIDPAQAAQVGATLELIAANPEMAALLNTPVAAAADFWSPNGSGHPYRPYVVENGTLQIPVQGVLLNKFPYQLGRWATGYAYIEKALSRGMADPDVKRIALLVDSPGGEVAGCFECGDKIFEAREGKDIRAFASDHAYSAAYALASSASELVVSRSGGTGSVGVVTAHYDFSKMLSDWGLKVTFIHAGKHKVDGNAYEPLPDSVKDRIQERIDKIYGVFVGAVSRNRNISEGAVRETEALTFDAQDSISRKFADRIGALEEELSAFAEAGTDADQEGESLMTTYTQEQLDAAVAAARAEGVTAGTAEGHKAGLAEGHKTGMTAERERRAKIMGSEEAKTRPAAAEAFAKRGTDADEAISMLGELPVEKAEGTTPKKPKAATSTFHETMETTENPNVGADAIDGEGEDDDKEMAQTNAILATAKAYRGINPKAS